MPVTLGVVPAPPRPVHPVRPGGIPLCFGGLSEDAPSVSGEHADVYALFGKTKTEVAGRTKEIRRVAAAAGNDALRFSLSTRPVVAETEEVAWEKADGYLEQARAHRELARRTARCGCAATPPANPPPSPPTVSSASRTSGTPTTSGCGSGSPN